MSFSSWLSLGLEPAAGARLKILAMPNWIASSLKSVGVRPADIQGQMNYGLCGDAPYEEYVARVRTIVSESDLNYHSRLTDCFDYFLFGKRAGDAELYKELIEAWHAIPLSSDMGMKLKVSLGGTGLIVIESDPVHGVEPTALYEPLLKAAHQLLSARAGLGGYNDPLFMEILDEYMKRMQLAA